MLDSESKLREAIQKMLNPEPPAVEEHDHSTNAKEEKGGDVDDLFTKENEDDDLESLFDEE